MLQFKMVNLKHLTLLIIVVVVAFLSYLFYSLNNIEKENFLISNIESALITTKNFLEEEKKQALSLAILLSEDKEFLEYFISNDRKKVFDTIQKKLKSISIVQPDKFKIQVHDKELKAYLRSWDYETSGVRLDSFRKGLVYAKENKTPFVSVELGLRLNIKAIAPIFIDDEFIGSIEVITEFESVSDMMKQRGYDFVVLLDSKYVDNSNIVQKNRKIKNYIVCNNVENISLLNSLENIEFLNLKDYGYEIGDVSFGYFSIYDLNNTNLGYILIALKKR
ncbi:cache domain-containing protein [Arcobacter sp. FWKO B]|uniref:cache domain-containing protein n=1 Tax=Arcobacter sp. FWKO B TaxID=2593672 RepID=UPI0018A6985C|nr:cache domain-containing protein [Arcobacter sp. FWKO B]QOG11928.1 hypothetical protein FWKOB_04085 [Arcobacter sp. FWKO B]